MRVLVTGGSGFLGNATLERLNALYPTWTLYNLDRSAPRTPQSFAQFVPADITNAASVLCSLSHVNPHAIIHTAGWVPNGQARYSSDKRLRAAVFAVNVGGTQNILAAATREGAACRALVYTSSCTVLSDDMRHDYANMSEEIPTGNATLAYGASKAVAEAAVLEADSRGLRTCALRPATIIGPGDTFGVVATIHACIAKGETPWVIGDGNNMYDFVYISNVADAHVLALENLLGEECEVDEDAGSSSSGGGSSSSSSSSSSSESENGTVQHNGSPESPKAKPDIRSSGNGAMQHNGCPSTQKPVPAGRRSGESAAGHAFFISNQEPIYFRDFMVAIWAQFGHYPPFQVRVPGALAWCAGLVAEVVSWATGAQATLSRGSVNDAIGIRYSDNTKARRVLGYVPRVGFAEGLRMACEDYKRILKEGKTDK